jgi:hypothetical protein
MFDNKFAEHDCICDPYGAVDDDCPLLEQAIREQEELELR